MAEVQVETGPFAKAISEGCVDIVRWVDPSVAIMNLGISGEAILETVLNLVDSGMTPDEIREQFRTERGVLLYEATASEREAKYHHDASMFRGHAWQIFWDLVGHPDDNAGTVDD